MKRLSGFKQGLPLSPLAGTTVDAVFCDEAHAAKAAKSLADAVTGGLSGEVVRVVPQSVRERTGARGVRVDVELRTDADETVIVEFQFFPDAAIYHRNLLAAAHCFTASSVPGDTAGEMARRMPKVVCLDLLGFTVRDDDPSAVQPVRLMYTLGPPRVAVDAFCAYAVQLPRALEQAADGPRGDLGCWLYALAKAHEAHMSLEEVCEMTPALQEFLDRDEGFRQYCESYGRANADPEVEDVYLRWVGEAMREEGQRQAALEEGRAEGRAEGEAGLVRRMASNGQGAADIARLTGYSVERIEALLGDRSMAASEQ